MSALADYALALGPFVVPLLAWLVCPFVRMDQRDN